MKIIALPRDPNPYQRLLYREVVRAGHSVRFACCSSPSHTVNLILLPLELALARAAGWKILHIHWVFVFDIPGSARFGWLRRIGQAWFTFVLRVCRVLGIRVVWTVHNVLPHERVFHDDIEARRRLASSSDVVLVHSTAALDELASLGIRPRRSALVTHGTLTPDLDASMLRPPGTGSAVRQFLFFGRVVRYKGVEDLLAAFRSLPETAPVRLVVAGACPDAGLRQRLRTLAADSEGRIELRLEYLADRELTVALADSDVVVLPFRRVTTSGSVLTAMGHGRPVVLPDLPGFANLPVEAVIFYDGSVDGLGQAIADIARWSPEQLQAVGAAASAYVSGLDWSEAAQQMLAAISN